MPLRESSSNIINLRFFNGILLGGCEVISTYSNILLSRVGVSLASGHFDCLKYLHETAEAPWDPRAVKRAHQNNHPQCLQYLLDNDCPFWRYEGGVLRTFRTL
ncbi:unnamed protein product [Bathycoccus prasinos]